MYSQYNNIDDTLSGHIIFSYYLFMSIDWMLKKWEKMNTSCTQENNKCLTTSQHSLHDRLQYNITDFMKIVFQKH